jgi:DNA mismatch repair ATPase MutS
VAHILDGAGPQTLVLIDELGRATSTHDGVAVCWCEALMAVRAPTLFATHFSQLAELANVYPQARLWKLQVCISTVIGLESQSIDINSSQGAASAMKDSSIAT